MDSLHIRADLLARLRKLSQGKGVSVIALVNLYLEACINYEEQMAARDTTVTKELEAVLVRMILDGEHDARKEHPPENPGAVAPVRRERISIGFERNGGPHDDKAVIPAITE